MDWSGVDYLWIIVMFLSAVWTLILTAPIHCRGSIGEQVMQCYISPNLMKKQTYLQLGWPVGEHIFRKCFFSFFWMNYFFKVHPKMKNLTLMETKISMKVSGNRGCQSLTFCLTSSLVFCWRRKVVQAWNVMSKWWEDFHFWVNYSIKCSQAKNIDL